jgi:NDP-sugar pyrophosphorylase family protein
MTVLRNEGRWDKSNADFDGKRVTHYSKSQGEFEWIDYGLLVLERDVVAEIPADQPSNLADLLTRLSEEGRLAGFATKERFYEIGSPSGLAALEAFLTT